METELPLKSDMRLYWTGRSAGGHRPYARDAEVNCCMTNIPSIVRPPH